MEEEQPWWKTLLEDPGEALEIAAEKVENIIATAPEKASAVWGEVKQAASDTRENLAAMGEQWVAEQKAKANLNAYEEGMNTVQGARPRTIASGNPASEYKEGDQIKFDSPEGEKTLISYAGFWLDLNNNVMYGGGDPNLEVARGPLATIDSVTFDIKVSQAKQHLMALNNIISPGNKRGDPTGMKGFIDTAVSVYGAKAIGSKNTDAFLESVEKAWTLARAFSDTDGNLQLPTDADLTSAFISLFAGELGGDSAAKLGGVAGPEQMAALINSYIEQDGNFSWEGAHQALIDVVESYKPAGLSLTAARLITELAARDYYTVEGAFPGLTADDQLIYMMSYANDPTAKASLADLEALEKQGSFGRDSAAYRYSLNSGYDKAAKELAGMKAAWKAKMVPVSDNEIREELSDDKDWNNGVITWMPKQGYKAISGAEANALESITWGTASGGELEYYEEQYGRDSEEYQDALDSGWDAAVDSAGAGDVITWTESGGYTAASEAEAMTAAMAWAQEQAAAGEDVYW